MNNPPIPIISDLHFGSKNFHKGIFEMQMTFFEKQFFPWCLKNGVKDVLCGGDVVHNRNFIDIWFDHQIKQRFFKWFEDNGIKLHTVIGNHDIYYKTTLEVNYLEQNAQQFKNIIVYSKQEKVQVGRYTVLMVPWVLHDEDFKFLDSADICLGHFDMQGFKMTKTMYSQDGFSWDDFKQYNLVFSGHYHIRSSSGNIHYVGCPYQLTWNDYDEEKGFYVLKDDFKIKWHSNEVNPGFVKVYYDESFDGERKIRVGGVKLNKLIEATEEEVLALAKSNYCRVVVNRVVNQSALDQFHASLQAVSVNNQKIDIVDANEIIETYDLLELEEEIKEEADLMQQVGSYVNGMTFDEGIDKSLLLNMFEQLFKDAAEMVVDDDPV